MNTRSYLPHFIQCVLFLYFVLVEFHIKSFSDSVFLFLSKIEEAKILSHFWRNSNAITTCFSTFSCFTLNLFKGELHKIIYAQQMRLRVYYILLILVCQYLHIIFKPWNKITFVLKHICFNAIFTLNQFKFIFLFSCNYDH